MESALMCSFCGAVLVGNRSDSEAAATAYIGVQPSLPVDDAATSIDIALIPEGGVGIQITGAPQPYYVPIYKELILGRNPDATLEAVLDLSDLDAFNMGISRRHAMLRRANSGFEVQDLSSRNGTWLNEAQLIPNKPYPFFSGSQIRLGRMRMVIMYHVKI
jgi:hypothetical protein